MTKIVEGEFDWFAIDREGYIGHFSSAGYGVVPIMVQKNVQDHLDLSAYFITNAREVTNAKLLESKGNRSDWLNMARRGLYSYDFEHWDGPYILIAKPAEPINIKHLPNQVHDLLLKVCFNNLSFKDSLVIQPQNFFSC